jgi:methylmalonyl-CoA carboxyltransferase small subunit
MITNISYEEESLVKVQVLIGGVAYEVEVEHSERDWISTAGIPVLPEMANPQSSVLPTAAMGGSDVEAEADPRVSRSPVAGLVVKVHVQPGQDVQRHELLLVLEAMKMETNVTAPVAGKLKCVNVGAGDAVKVGQILLEFE